MVSYVPIRVTEGPDGVTYLYGASSLGTEKGPFLMIVDASKTHASVNGVAGTMKISQG